MRMCSSSSVHVATRYKRAGRCSAARVTSAVQAVDRLSKPTGWRFFPVEQADGVVREDDRRSSPTL